MSDTSFVSLVKLRKWRERTKNIQQANMWDKKKTTENKRLTKSENRTTDSKGVGVSLVPMISLTAWRTLCKPVANVFKHMMHRYTPGN